MTIFQKNDALSYTQKSAIKNSYEELLNRFGGEYPLATYNNLLKDIATISTSTEKNVIELSIYLKAVTQYLDLKVNRRFALQGERKLLAALRYFSEAQDVIPDWETDGYIDDIYCLNLAIKAQSKNNLLLIEKSAQAIKRHWRVNFGAE
jgi:uncharacterized membrane protein YkvA (DUF1232 family)